MRATCLGWLSVLPIFAASVLAESPASSYQDFESMDAYVNELAARDQFSGVIVIEQHGQRVYARAFGLADRTTRTPVTLDTPFLIATQGRMFAAVAMLQLVQAGKIRLDDTVGEYIPEYPNRDIADNATIRLLLTHRGGPGDVGLLDIREPKNRDRVRTPAEFGLFNDYRTPLYRQGTDSSDYSFMLLGSVIERATSQGYTNYLEQHVLRPAGMRHTRFTPQASGVAVGYTTVNGQLRSTAGLLPWRGLPMGGGVSTADDEIRFVTALNQGKLISPTTLADAASLQIPGFGHGFMEHSGGAPGISSVAAYYPATDLAMVCLSNRDPPLCDDVLSRLHSSLATEYGGSRLQ